MVNFGTAHGLSARGSLNYTSPLLYYFQFKLNSILLEKACKITFFN